MDLHPDSHHAQKDDFEKGLQHLIADDRWSNIGKRVFSTLGYI
jgi:hypothetical protein